MNRVPLHCVLVDKPHDWPLNAFEDLLDRIQKATSSFIENPGFQTREVLVSLINAHDYNQQSVFGEDRVSEYEVAVLNHLYEQSLMLCYPTLRCFLYSFIGLRTRMQKMLHYMSLNIPDLGEALPLNVDSYENGLIPTLFFYYKVYQSYTVNKEHSFSEELCIFAQECIDSNSSDEDYRNRLDVFERSFTTIINDISFSRGNKAEDIWFFDRKELYSIIAVQAQMMNILGKNPAERPLRTMLMAEIGNYILRSRNDYNNDRLYKYISEDVSRISVQNCEIWMSSIDMLNDSREGRVLEEVFADDSLVKPSWVSDSISFEKKRLYYVSSFSRNGNEEKMKMEYGPVVLGFKNDRIGDLISPIRRFDFNQEFGKSITNNVYIPMFSTVIAFDVIYEKEKLKEELRFLFELINLFSMSDSDKNRFLENILQYWLLSAKDDRWEYEKERRYLLFLFNENDYYETRFENGFIKEKSSILVLPDFVLGKHRDKVTIGKNIESKRKTLSSQPYLYCNNCFYWDYDLARSVEKIDNCPVCGSKHISVENMKP